MGENTTNMQKHLSTQHAITLQECHVFDALRSDDNVNESQPSNSSATNVSASSVHIEGKLRQTLSIVLVPFVSLCKPAFRSDDNVNESQPSNSSATNVSASSVHIEGKLRQTLSIVLVPFVSLCKPAF